MKQHITEKQFQSLSEKAMERLADWAVKHVEDELPRQLSIGQMIEFLDQYTDKSGYGEWVKFGIFKNRDWAIFQCEHDEVPRRLGKEHKELCDALWEKVKDILENEKVAEKRKK